MSSITLGNVNYDISLTTQSNAELGEGNRGRIWYEKLTMYIDKNLPEELKIQTLYHELAHGICEETSFNGMLMDKLGENGYEIFIDSLGKTIYSMIHMNDMNLIEDYIKKSK